MTKYKFKQTVPAFIDRMDPLEFDFNSLEELEHHSFVQRCLNSNHPSYLSRSDDYLMVVYNDGFSAWCIGRITNIDKLGLPEYQSKYIVQYIGDGKLEIKTENSENAVVSICGDKATLENGTICRHIKYDNCKKDSSLWRLFEELK